MLFNFPINFTTSWFNGQLIKDVMISSSLRFLNKANFQLKSSCFIKPDIRFYIQSTWNSVLFSQMV